MSGTSVNTGEVNLTRPGLQVGFPPWRQFILFREKIDGEK